MKIFKNENIMKIIYDNYNLLRIKNLLTQTKTRALIIVILRAYSWDKIFNGMGKSKYIIKNEKYMLSLIQLPNNNLVTGSYNSELKIWDISKLTCLKIINDDTSVRSITLLPNNKMASSSLNHIKIWSTKGNYKCIKVLTYEGYLAYDNLVVLDNYLACSASAHNGYNILLLDCKKYTIVKVLEKHPKNISSLVNLQNNKLASSSFDKTIKIWNIAEHYNCLYTLIGHNDQVLCLAFKKTYNLLLSGSNDKTIKVWNIDNYL
jgi:WD40 repeat protein